MRFLNKSALRAALLGMGTLTFGLVANAEIVELENTMKFDINPQTNEAVCTYFMKYTYNHDGDAPIPDEITWEGKTYKVIGIGSKACINNTGLKKLMLGKNIRFMDEQAVYGSSALEEVVFNDALETIGTQAFQGCSALKSLTLPKSVKTIGDYAFMSCPFESFTIPASVDSIGNNPFRAGTKLKSITLEEGVKNYKIVNGALLTADGKKLISLPAGNGLTEYTTPSGVELIGPQSIRNNPTLEKITISEGVKTLGEYSMGAMANLTTVNIPASVTTIGEAALYYNSKLTTLNLAAGSPFTMKDGYLYGNGGKLIVFTLLRTGDVVVPEGAEVIGEYAFYYMSGMTSVKLPSSVKRIERGAFASNSGLKSIEFGDKLEYIGISAFQSCSVLDNVVLPLSTRILDKQAFTYCYGLSNITLNKGLEEIGDMAFYGDRSLNSVTIPGTVKVWENASFYQCTGLESVVVEEGVTAIPDLAFDWDSELQKVTLPESLRIIGVSAFDWCKKLQDINIPSGVTSIGGSAFQGSIIKEMTIPEGVTVLNDFTFASMKNLERLTIHDNIDSIQSHAIHACDNLLEVNLGKKLKYLGDRGVSLNPKITKLVFPATLEAFGEYSINYNTGMTDLYVMNPIPVELEYDFFDPEAYAFPGYEKIKLHVPEGTRTAYENAPIWNKFLFIVDDVKISGIDEMNKDARVISTKFYDMNGNEVVNTEFGQVYVKISVYEDGTTSTVKVIGE